ncbi:MAG: HEAT repeat domain-containing protein [Deltaproteobacteria bacterium]|nr:HEAT repeat domain-containing protein [Deltaproteobacteria bacterium]
MSSIHQLRQDLGGESEDARFAAWMEIYQSGDDEIQIERERILSGSDSILKVFFARFLAKVPEERSVDYLCRLLSDENSVVRETAKRSFERNSCESKLKKLLPLLLSPSIPVRSIAIEKLSRGGVMEAVQPLLMLFHKAFELHDNLLLNELLTAFRHLPDRIAFRSVLRCLHHEEEEIRVKVVLVLGALYELGMEPSRKYLTQSLTDPSPRVRRVILWCLKKDFSRKNLRSFLHFSAEDPDPLVRQEALLGLRHFNSRNVVGHLLAVLVREKERLVKLQCEGVLLGMPEKELVRSLRRLLGKQDEKLRAKALLLLAEFQPDSEELYRLVTERLQRSPHDRGKLPFIEALGLFNLAKVIPHLEKELKGSGPLAYAAMTSLVRLWDKGIKVDLLRYLSDLQISPLLKQIILRSFVRKGASFLASQDLLKILTQFLKDENINIRYLAAQGLMTLDPAKAFDPVLEAFLKETDQTSLKFMKEGIFQTLWRDPRQLVDAIARYRTHPEVIALFFSALKERPVSGDQFLSLLKSLALPPVGLFSSEYRHLGNDLIRFYLSHKKITLTSLLECLSDLSERWEILSSLTAFLEKEPDLRVALSADLVRQWLSDPEEDHQRTIVSLLGFSEGYEATQPLVEIVCDDQRSFLHEEAVRSLHRLIGENYA